MGLVVPKGWTQRRAPKRPTERRLGPLRLEALRFKGPASRGLREETLISPLPLAHLLRA
jgi:hypothetical protein